MTDEPDMRAFLKAEIAKRYRYSRGWYHDHIPSVVTSEAFAENVLDIPQLAGMIAALTNKERIDPSAPSA